MAQRRVVRAGRTGPGKCFRLYTKKDFINELDEQSYPEIIRSNLGSMVLGLVALDVTDLVHFDYFDTPAPESIMRALEILNYLGALDDEGNVTELGWKMVNFPVQPQLAKALVSSPDFGCSDEILTIVSMMVLKFMFPVIDSSKHLNSTNQRKGADSAGKQFTDPRSDHLTLLKAFNSYKQNEDDRAWPPNNHLSVSALRQADSIRTGLLGIMAHMNIQLSSSIHHPQTIQMALTSGFFMQAAQRRKNTKGYLTVKDNQVVGLCPSCGLDPLPEWVIFNEFVLTHCPLIRTVTEVKLKWLLAAAPLYFDVESFPEGEVKRALKGISKKNKGKRRGGR